MGNKFPNFNNVGEFISMDAPFASAGLRIKALRGDLSLREFASRLGVDHKSVSGWESGKRLPDGSSLLALTEQFSADVNYILTGQRSQSLAVSTLNIKLLTDVIKLVEQLLAKTGRTFTPAQKAKHVAALYQAFASGQEMDANAIAEALARAA